METSPQNVIHTIITDLQAGLAAQEIAREATSHWTVSRLESLKSGLIDAFAHAPDAVVASDALSTIVKLRIFMNRAVFASSDERAIIDGVLTRTFQANRHLVTPAAVAQHVDRALEDDRDYAARFDIAGTMLNANPAALTNDREGRIRAVAQEPVRRGDYGIRQSYAARFLESQQQRLAVSAPA